jgi:hypothetical protein
MTVEAVLAAVVDSERVDLLVTRDLHDLEVVDVLVERARDEAGAERMP